MALSASATMVPGPAFRTGVMAFDQPHFRLDSWRVIYREVEEDNCKGVISAYRHSGSPAALKLFRKAFLRLSSEDK